MFSPLKLDGIYILLLGSMVSAFILLAASVGIELTTMLYLLLGILSSITILWGGLSLHIGKEADAELSVFLINMTL